MLHPAREGVRVGVVKTLQSHDIHELYGDLTPLLLGDSPRMEPKLDVFQNCLPRKERILLKDEGAVRARGDNRVSPDGYLTFGWLLQPPQKTEQRCLSAPRGAKDTEKLTFAYRGAYMVKGRHSPVIAFENFCQVTDGDFLTTRSRVFVHSPPPRAHRPLGRQTAPEVKPLLS